MSFEVSNKLQEWLTNNKIDIEPSKKELDHKILIFSRITFDLLNEKESKQSINKEWITEDYNKILDHIKKTFIDDKLKEKFLFESTVKNLVISDLNWEIINKRYDSNAQKKVSNLNTILLKVSLEDKSNLSPFKDVDNDFIIEMDEDKLDYVIDELKKIKLNIKNG